jgi:hypothetical protein
MTENQNAPVANLRETRKQMAAAKRAHPAGKKAPAKKAPAHRRQPRGAADRRVRRCHVQDRQGWREVEGDQARGWQVHHAGLRSGIRGQLPRGGGRLPEGGKLMAALALALAGVALAVGTVVAGVVTAVRRSQR